ncbi:TlpA family protein disulfide reductase [Geoalkalibacter sp.]|uniref:TlpA family protein disulfide reductase n=1 Tax=Geoalkalibacter sp. TaxID=3041440 RepID=UPI00272DD080|nr:TlpA disulfide reductase family protein [Geoalkalibacter sp.]
MRRFLAVLVALAILSGSLEALAGSPRPDAPPVSSVRVGTVAPDFTLPTYDGGSVTLSHLRGKVVLINFWATWCPPCRTEKPTMENLYQKFAERGDFVLLAVNVEEDARQALESYLKRTPYSFPIPIDAQGQVQNLYHVYRFPESFIIDRNGIVVDHVIGARDWSDPKTQAYIAKLLGE